MRNDVRAKIRNPTAVVRACRNARSDQQRYGVDASQVIYRVVAHWKNDEPNAALELAVWGDEKAMGRHPDIKCLLGRAYLNVVPQDLGAADAVLREAYSLGCGREELIPLWIDAKRKLKDWYGLIEITSLADRTAPSADNVVVRALAYREIGTNFAELGAYRDAAERFREGARDVQKAFHNNQARGRTRELSELGASLYMDYVSLLQRSTPPDAGLEVWEAACEAFDNYCRRSFLFRIGLREVMTWWDHVERGRDVPHPNTAIKMERILESIAAYRKTLINVQWSDTALLDEMASVLSSLTARLETYRAQLSPA